VIPVARSTKGRRRSDMANEMTVIYRGAEVTLTEDETIRIFALVINAIQDRTYSESLRDAATKFADTLTNHLP
jgi:hypothetical protein